MVSFWYQNGKKSKNDVFLRNKKGKENTMIVVSSRDFRTNMMSYFTESNGDDFITRIEHELQG